MNAETMLALAESLALRYAWEEAFCAEVELEAYRLAA